MNRLETLLLIVLILFFPTTLFSKRELKRAEFLALAGVENSYQNNELGSTVAFLAYYDIYSNKFPERKIYSIFQTADYQSAETLLYPYSIIVFTSEISTVYAKYLTRIRSQNSLWLQSLKLTSNYQLYLNRDGGGKHQLFSEASILDDFGLSSNINILCSYWELVSLSVSGTSYYKEYKRFSFLTITPILSIKF